MEAMTRAGKVFVFFANLLALGCRAFYEWKFGYFSCTDSTDTQHQKSDGMVGFEQPEFIIYVFRGLELSWARSERSALP